MSTAEGLPCSRRTRCTLIEMQHTTHTRIHEQTRETQRARERERKRDENQDRGVFSSFGGLLMRHV